MKPETIKQALLTELFAVPTDRLGVGRRVSEKCVGRNLDYSTES